jgi:hypothetical protein
VISLPHRISEHGAVRRAEVIFLYKAAGTGNCDLFLRRIIELTGLDRLRTAGFGPRVELVVLISRFERGDAIVTLARMVTNVVLEAVLGAIPIFGDVFHVMWKANRRNYRLFMREKSRQPGESPAWRDALFLSLLLVTVLCLAAIPIGLILWLVRSRKIF